MTKISAFLKDEAGAVTVDWVVLTAAIVGIGMIVFLTIRPAVSNIASATGDRLGHAQACLLSTTIAC
jgi:Flp pilus assembly pilin Flp